MEWPHTEENYLIKEMGFRIARKHATKLRAVRPLSGVRDSRSWRLRSPWRSAAAIATLAALIAVASQAPGMLVERWLFFAEAKHTVTLYYGR